MTHDYCPKLDRPEYRESVANIWGDRVREAREDLGLTQVDLARLAEVTQQSVSLIEKGKVLPRDGLKRTLARVLGKAPNELFEWPKPRGARR
ncbi:MAG: helix-turn-helix domain-containing protein [Gemmataceae bacterium]|nr:helix-turn-helix domain-containing protein [Gemmataceae bacterium]